MVMNEFYGNRETLPFDLRHKAGPILYRLAENVDSRELKQTKKTLVADLKTALRSCLEHYRIQHPKPRHEETQWRETRAQYFDSGEPLTDRENNRVTYGNRPLLYLRVIPVESAANLSRAEIKDIACGINIEPLVHPFGGGASWSTNSRGGITYSREELGDGSLLVTSSQVFRNREIWGVDATLLYGFKVPMLPMIEVEAALRKALPHYLIIAKEHLNLGPPLLIEGGASRVSRFHLATGSNYSDRQLRPVLAPEIWHRERLESFDETEVTRVLLRIFEEFFDAAGERRPADFGGFPPDGDAS